MAAWLDQFQNLDPDRRDRALDTQARQLAAWINVYNGCTQHFLKHGPSLYLKP